MTGNVLRRERSLELAEILLPPQVANALFAGYARLFPSHRYGRGRFAGVEKADRHRAVRHFLNEHLTSGDIDVVSLNPERVLIEIEHFIVRQQTQREGVEFVDRRADDERCPPTDTKG